MRQVHIDAFRRRLVVAPAIFAGSIGLGIPAIAEANWPSRPVRLVVPFAPGNDDAKARAIGSKISARIGQPVIIENKGGAGGSLGADAVAKSAADGHTLLFAGAGLTTSAAGGSRLPYDAQKDLQAVGLVASTPLIVVVPQSSPFTTLGDLIRAARAAPGQINFGSGGPGSMSHLGLEALAARASIKLVHVPYKGVTPALADLAGGNLQMVLSTLASATPLIKAGKLRPLAVTTAERSPFMEHVPTASESGLGGFQIEFWWGILGPAGMPPATLMRMNDELNRALAEPEIKELLAREAAVPRPGKPEALAQLISSEIAGWTKLIAEKRLVVG